MTTTIYNDDNLTLSLYTGVASVRQYIDGHKSDDVRFSNSTKKVIIMTNYIAQLHQAKLDTLNSASLYASTMQAIVNEYTVDTATIGRIILESINSDYPVIETRDSKILKTALNSFQNAAHAAGEMLADGIGGKIVFKFSTAGGKDNKVRTVSCEHLTQKQVDTVAARALEDEKIANERACTDEILAKEKMETERDSLSDLDVFLRVKQYMADTFPHADIRAVISAGMGWIDQQELNSLTDAEVEENQTATG